MTEQMDGQLNFFDLVSPCGKTSQALSPVIKAETSGPSLKRSAGLKISELMFLNLRRGGWKHAGCIVGTGYSIAWRLYDAQFWGVPQRRKRIYLIADFGSERAGEILFERESLRWDSETSRKARESAARYVAGCADGSGWCRWMTE